jgi:hypothetical protein
MLPPRSIFAEDSSNPWTSFWGAGHIGKEANRWEEQFYLGENPEAQIIYGRSVEEVSALAACVQQDPMEARREQESALLGAVGERCAAIGQRKFALQAGIDHSNLEAFLRHRRRPGRRTIAKLWAALDDAIRGRED